MQVWILFLLAIGKGELGAECGDQSQTGQLQRTTRVATSKLEAPVYLPNLF